MGSILLAVTGAFLVAGLAVTTHFLGRGRRPRGAVVCTNDVALVPTPIDQDWLLDGGQPVTDAAEIARAADGTTCVYLWQTTRAHFRWEHASDETVTVLAGEAFVLDQVFAHESPPGGFDPRPERRLGPGDVAFFPAGARTIWRVPDHLRKVSTLTRPLPPALARVMHWLRLAKCRIADSRTHRPGTRSGARPMIEPVR